METVTWTSGAAAPPDFHWICVGYSTFQKIAIFFVRNFARVANFCKFGQQMINGSSTALCESIKPNTHRRRRRDSTVELSRVSVGCAYLALVTSRKRRFPVGVGV